MMNDCFIFDGLSTLSNCHERSRWLYEETSETNFNCHSRLLSRWIDFSDFISISGAVLGKEKANFIRCNNSCL
jgi:hypothetical protein